MQHINWGRFLLFFGGLAAVLLSVALQGSFPTDPAPVPPVGVPGPSSFSILALGGMLMMVLAVVRRRSK